MNAANPVKLAPLLILSGPSASGKSTLLERLVAEGPWPMRLSVSVTTRARRPSEVEGVHYHFWTPEQFLQAQAEGKFLEWAQVHGNHYGTLDDEVAPYRAQGVGVWLDIDVQGWRQVRRRYPEAISIFVATSSMAELERRLRQRNTETEEMIQRRLRNAEAELKVAGQYDYQVLNDDLPTALATLRGLLGPLFAKG